VFKKEREERRGEGEGERESERGERKRVSERKMILWPPSKG